MTRPAAPLERTEQATIVRLLTRAGWWVYSTSGSARPGGTRCTPGIPDLLCIGPDPLPSFTVEVKRTTGARIREAQRIFADRCARSRDMPPCYVGWTAAICRAWLIAEGYLIEGPDGDVFPYLLAGDRPTGPVTRFEDI